jgi:hypothetical protein
MRLTDEQLDRLANAGAVPTCPACGYRGLMERKPAGSPAIAILLLLTFIVPGIFYLMFFGGDVWACPQCGARVAKATR